MTELPDLALVVILEHIQKTRFRISPTKYKLLFKALNEMSKTRL